MFLAASRQAMPGLSWQASAVCTASTHHSSDSELCFKTVCQPLVLRQLCASSVQADGTSCLMHRREQLLWPLRFLPPWAGPFPLGIECTHVLTWHTDSPVARMQAMGTPRPSASPRSPSSWWNTRWTMAAALIAIVVTFSGMPSPQICRRNSLHEGAHACSKPASKHRVQLSLTGVQGRAGACWS